MTKVYFSAPEASNIREAQFRSGDKILKKCKHSDGSFYFRRGDETIRKSDVARKSQKKQEKRMARIESRRAAKAERSNEAQTGQNLDVNV